jgi:hypothetical protein
MKTLFPFLLLLAVAPALAEGNSLLTCRAIADNGARLACYDALSPAQAAAPREAAFGQGNMGQKAEPDTIASHIPGSFDGWTPNQKITLANGQVWKIADDSDAYVSGDNLKVTLTRGAFGALYLQVEGLSKMARVQRIK